MTEFWSSRWSPPLIITEEQIETVFSAICRALLAID
jgi:acetylornithine/succinyldiaminopimelate/putrescine aminotransferase